MEGSSQNATEPGTLLMCYPLVPSFLSKNGQGEDIIALGPIGPLGPSHPLAHQCTPPLARPLPTWGVCVWCGVHRCKQKTGLHASNAPPPPPPLPCTQPAAGATPFPPSLPRLILCRKSSARAIPLLLFSTGAFFSSPRPNWKHDDPQYRNASCIVRLDVV